MRLADDEAAAEANADEVAIIFSFLHPEDIMRLRRVCTTRRDAAKKTLVPLTSTDFSVNNERSYNAMRVMTSALPLPNLQQFSTLVIPVGLHSSMARILTPASHYGCGRTSPTANMPAHDINVISNFRKLRVLHIDVAGLNGRYRFLSSFPLLQKLTISQCNLLKWDLEILSGLPLLKELYCYDFFQFQTSIQAWLW